ncbi:MAG TPA: hypothetical protein VHZ07_20870 [Bryobacteraceae bacterium]|jgi:hypothetical protein|nr:hypothetical protein [Bryobacteraceae bacterium]
MKPSHYRIQENAAYKLSRHEFNHQRHTERHGHEAGNHHHHAHHENEAQHRRTDATFKVAHLVQLAGILTPVAVSHFIKEPENQWRAVRLASIITAVLTGGIWEAHNYKRKHEQQQHGDWVSRVCDELGENGMGHTPPR